MSNKEKAEIVAMLDSLIKTLHFTTVGKHYKDSNYILRFDLIERERSEINRFGKFFAAGTYVRPVWSNNPNRTDGYYDINVSGENVNGVFYSVTKWLTKNYI